MAEGASGGELNGFRRTGEEYYTTLIRASVGYEQATEALDRMNIKTVEFADIQNQQGNVDTETIRDSLLNTLGRTYETKTREITEATIKNTVLVFDNLSETLRGVADQDYMAEIQELTTYTQSYQVATDAHLTGLGELIKGYDGSAEGLVTFYTTLDDFQFQLQHIGMSVREVSQEMIDGAGSLDALTSGQNYFVDNYFTDLEQSEIAMSALNREFEALNLSVPETKDQYRELLESVTDPKLYGELITLADDYANMDNLRTEALQEQTKATEEAIRAEEDRVQKIEDFIKSSKLDVYSPLSYVDKYNEAKKNFELSNTTEDASTYLGLAKSRSTTREEYELEYGRTVGALRKTEKVESPTYTANGAMIIEDQTTSKKIDDLAAKVGELTVTTDTASKTEVQELKNMVLEIKRMTEESVENANRVVDATEKASYQKAI
jgi:hypothetical protein